MSERVWPAPAKLNLFLHIVGRRPNGYHLLQTVFQFLNFGDSLRFELRGDGVVRRTNAIAGLAPENDLVVRAARLLREASGTALGVDISLDKVLPMGAGLGGGSSDAATVLVALNRLWALHLSQDQLMTLGLQLGADVPIFIYGRAAWAEGVGEEFTPVDLDEPWYVVLVPPCHVATAEIFGAAELTRDMPPIKIPAFLSGEGRNVCEPVVRQRYPQVAEALDWLAQFGAPRMSGTGAAVFAAFNERSVAERVKEQAPASWRAMVVRGCNRSPLLRMTDALKDS